MVRTIVVSRVGWTSYKGCFRVAPHDVACERFAALDVVSGGRFAALAAASDERCAALHVAPDERCAVRRAVVHAVSYRTLLERLVRQWLVLEPLALEQLVLE
jgi:hypothetical protein